MWPYDTLGAEASSMTKDGIARLPRWRAIRAQDQREMADWVNWQLDKALEQEIGRLSISDPAFEQWLFGDGPTLEAARKGNLDPLRKRYPHIAKYLNLPRQKRGKYQRAVKRPDLMAAVRDVGLIRELWEDHYGKRRRLRDEKPTAAEIAAERWDVSEADVENQLKRGKAKNVTKSVRRSP